MKQLDSPAYAVISKDYGKTRQGKVVFIDLYTLLTTDICRWRPAGYPKVAFGNKGW